MSEISDFEARITTAMERIGRVVDVLGAQVEAPEDEGGIDVAEMEAEIGRLQDALQAEKDAKAQLEARVEAIQARQEGHVAELEAEVAQLRSETASLKADRAEDARDIEALVADLRAALALSSNRINPTGGEV
nr:hypothetical protein [uncultured Celeribacter sp.]